MFQYNNKSLFSHVSEESKILFFATSACAAFVFSEPLLQAILALALLSFLVYAGYRNFRAFLYILPFLALADFALWFFLQGSSINIAKTVLVSNIRIFNLLFASSLFTFSTDVFALLKLLKGLKLPETIYLPVYVMFRFLPEAEKDLIEIMAMQKLKGISRKNPLLYLKSILLPLFYTLFQKADELAIAYYLRKKQDRI